MRRVETGRVVIAEKLTSKYNVECFQRYIVVIMSNFLMLKYDTAIDVVFSAISTGPEKVGYTESTFVKQNVAVIFSFVSSTRRMGLFHDNVFCHDPTCLSQYVLSYMFYCHQFISCSGGLYQNPKKKTMGKDEL